MRTRRAFGGAVAGVEEEVVDFCCCVVLLVLFCSFAFEVEFIKAFEDVDAADILLLCSMLSFSGAQFFSFFDLYFNNVKHLTFVLFLVSIFR